MPAPIVGIVSGVRVQGANSINDFGKVPPINIVTLQEVMERQFDSDIFFCCYTPKGAEVGGPLCRMNKPILGELRENGEDLVSRIICIDIDIPHSGFKEKKKWTEELIGEFSEAFDQLCSTQAILSQPAFLYTTAHGSRIGYVLSDSIPVDEQEYYTKQVVAAFQNSALKPWVDLSCVDWTRLFRAPNVVRDERQSWTQPFFYCEYHPDRIILLDELRQVWGEVPEVKLRRFAEIEKLDHGKVPNVDECKSLLLETGTTKQSRWCKEAYKRLRGRECLEYIKNLKRVEEIGTGRNNALQRLIGSSVGILFYLNGTSPNLIYALWIDCLEGLQDRTGDDSGRDWYTLGWHMVCHCWEKTYAQQLATQELQKEAENSTGRLSDEVLSNVRTWCKAPEISDNSPIAYEWLTNHLIATDGRGAYHPLKPDGTYDTHPSSIATLPARIRELGMTPLLPITEISDTGKDIKSKFIAPQHLINKYCTKFSFREGKANIPGSIIRGVGGDSATFQFKMYSRKTDLIPTFNPYVDRWLFEFAEGMFEDLTNWISWSLAFEEGPICALSIDGPPGIGKKLLVEGLAECIDSETLAHAREMTGRFQNQILRTPFLVVNEGLPRLEKYGSQDAADTFRSMVSGDTLHIEQKHQGLITINNPMRIIITANNDTILRTLYQNRDLSIYDREALSIRLFHMKVGNKGSVYLNSLGGMDFTARPGNRWIRGDDGSASDYVLARHFLWLYKNRVHTKKGKRLLVEGVNNVEIIKDMAVSSGSAPEILEALIKAVTSQETLEGIMTQNTGIFVTAAGMKDYFTQLCKIKGVKCEVNLHRILSVLTGLTEDGWQVNLKSIGGETVKRKWYKIDLPTLLYHAEKYGYRTDKILELIPDRVDTVEGEQ